MADPNNEFPNTLPFLHSPVFIGIVVSFASHALAMFGKHVAPDILNNFVQNGLECVSLAAAGYAAYKRWRAPIQPLTIKKADEVAVDPLSKTPEIPK
jgi:hypothetical protein